MKYQKIIDILSKIESLTSVPFIVILRNSMINVVPIIVVGSFFLLFFVFCKQYGIQASYVEFFRKLYLVSMGIVSIYLAFCIGYNFAVFYGKDGVIYALVSSVCFIVCCAIYEDWNKLSVFQFISLLGVKNMFSCIIISFISCYIFNRLQIRVLNDSSIPRYVLNSLNSIIPFLITLLVVAFISNFMKLNEFLKMVLLPFENFGDNILVVWITNIFLHLTNFLGIHGISLVNSIFLSLWQKYLVINAEMIISGKEATYITAYPFFQWFIWIGGAGSTLGLNILLLFSRSSYLRTIARGAIVPSLFNINEPLLFGIPIILNPYFLVPFMIVPLILGTISFVAFSLNLVGKVYVEAPWMLPSPIGAFLATTDYRAIILNLFNIIISALIYLPFVIAYEKSLQKNDKTHT
ncbi:MAG: PTS transporter subunit EIIC [bacterium]